MSQAAIEPAVARLGVVLRTKLPYMGWVKRNLAGEGEKVEGLIIARAGDGAVRYALAAVADVGLRLYGVEFRLREVGR